jgi:predicted RNA-binding Zn ribbon-like protein
MCSCRVTGQTTAAPGFDFLAGSACLDLANTVSGRLHDRHSDRLRTYDDLLAWSVQAGLISTRRARQLRAAAKRDAPRIAEIFRRTTALREAIYAIFSSVAHRKTIPPTALATLNRELTEAMTNVRLVPHKRKFNWQLPPEVCGLYLPLQVIARNAAELLTSGHLDQIRECAGETCGWLFLDHTRNHSRLWCDMRACGNREKQARFRQRSAA